MQHAAVIRELDIELITQDAAFPYLVVRQNFEVGQAVFVLDLVYSTAFVLSHDPAG